MRNLYSILIHFKKKAFLVLCLVFIFQFGIIGQNQTVSDSLETEYLAGNYKEFNKLKILSSLALNLENPEKQLKYSLELIETAKLLDSSKYLFDGYLSKGNALRLKSDLIQAQESYFNAAKIAEEREMTRRLGRINISIADVYSIMGNHTNSINHYRSAIKILKKEHDSIGVASALLNAGDGFFNQQELDSAMVYFKESQKIFTALNYEIGIAYNLGNIGMVYADQGKDNLAEENMDKAITILEKLKDYYPISVYLTYLSDIYLKQNNWNKALSYSKRSLELAKKYGLKKQISESNLQLSKLYEKVGNQVLSYKYYKDHIVFRDSVKNIESVQKLADISLNYEVSQKQKEIDLLEKDSEIQRLKDNKQKNIIYATAIVLVLTFLLVFGLYRRFKFIKKTSSIIEEERNRSENLLLNILPLETALELKQNGKVKAQKFESVTVLFTDFKKFTEFSENLTPEELVESVDFYFSKFDEIIDKYGLEKIKTIGDAYMCAGGLPFPTEDHALKMIFAAKEIIDFVATSKSNKGNITIPFDIRIGINTGPVVAGVVGIKKFAYDIWGDTVNIASRMESNSEVGKINVSQNTYELIKDHYNCEYRGKIEAKNRGMLKMYFVNDKKTIATNNSNQIHKIKILN